MTKLINLFRAPGRFEALFSMSDRELTARGYSREGLARSYVTGLSIS